MTAAERARQDEAFDRWMDGMATDEDFKLMLNAEFSPKREVRPTEEAHG